MTYTIYPGNNLDILPTLADNSVDAIVTDPPYELGFMGKKWDSSGIAYSVELWRECLRVLKPGGHLLSFGGTRTWHRVAVAIEDAGFEVRDSIAWMYGSGFPKSLDVSKAIDKAAGAERERVPYKGGIASGQGNYGGGGQVHDGTKVGDDSVTPEAQTWEGWGTALKPAFEPIVVARKPLIGTVAENVLTHGTGALNIDGSRVGTEERTDKITENGFGSNFMDDGWKPSGNSYEKTVKGRWPANVILDEYSAEILDEQSGLRGGGYGIRGKNDSLTSYGFAQGTGEVVGYGDIGGASRFFYCAKASKRDRNEGLDGLPTKVKPYGNREEVPTEGDPIGSVNDKFTTQPAQNFHPTVKPTDLMRYLIKLVTPPGGVVLDPFTGSGSTGKAAILEGFDFIGIELTEDYLPIIEGRLKWAEHEFAKRELEKSQGLF